MLTQEIISRIAHDYIDELEWCPMHICDDAPFDGNGIEVDDVAQICCDINRACGVHPDVTEWEYYPNSIIDLCNLYLGRERAIDIWKDAAPPTPPSGRFQWLKGIMQRVLERMKG